MLLRITIMNFHCCNLQFFWGGGVRHRTGGIKVIYELLTQRFQISGRRSYKMVLNSERWDFPKECSKIYQDGRNK
jgi:hypothetical protein